MSLSRIFTKKTYWVFSFGISFGVLLSFFPKISLAEIECPKSNPVEQICQYCTDGSNFLCINQYITRICNVGPGSPLIMESHTTNCVPCNSGGQVCINYCTITGTISHGSCFQNGVQYPYCSIAENAIGACQDGSGGGPCIPINQYCYSYADCCSQMCVNNSCQTSCISESYSCTQNSDCCSGSCLNADGYLYCGRGDQGDYCRTGLDCSDSYCENGICRTLLTVNKAGTGTGLVVSSPAGIDCGPDCNEYYATPVSVALTPTPSGNSVFTGWNGDCSGTGACTVVMSQIRTVTATFNLTLPQVVGLVKIKHPLGILSLRLISFSDALFFLKGILKIARFGGDNSAAADLVEIGDPNASPVHVKTPYGIKAWRMAP